MRPLRDLRGLKFPDDYVVRHVFKRGLHEKVGRVLELGCGVGNNLGLYRAYDWSVTGVDIDPSALADAAWNLEGDADLLQADLSLGLPPLTGSFQALIAPNLLCYLTRDQAQRVLIEAAGLLVPGAEVFVRTRLVDDYRYGRGQETEPDGFILATPETGEQGLFNRFYTAAGLLGLLDETLRLTDSQALAVRFDNLQSGRRVCGNSDLVVWGRTPA